MDSRDEWGWTPLHEATRFGHLEVSRVLVDHGANVNSRQEDHWTPIQFSAGGGYLEIVKLLLECGADVHTVNGHGDTAYQVSQQFGYREIAELLWEHGGDRTRFEEILFWLNVRCLTCTSILGTARLRWNPLACYCLLFLLHDCISLARDNLKHSVDDSTERYEIRH